MARAPRVKEALSIVMEFAQRDPIEFACNRVRGASDAAYFYAVHGI
jgi:hypothetical protein